MLLCYFFNVEKNVKEFLCKEINPIVCKLPFLHHCNSMFHEKKLFEYNAMKGILHFLLKLNTSDVCIIV
jgi:hypothetical protein